MRSHLFHIFGSHREDIAPTYLTLATIALFATTALVYVYAAMH